jgi:hypothetical protein
MGVGSEKGCAQIKGRSGANVGTLWGSTTHLAPRASRGSAAAALAPWLEAAAPRVSLGIMQEASTQC